MVTRWDFWRVALLALLLGGSVALPADAQNGRNKGWEQGDRGQHRGHDRRRDDRRHDHRHVQPRGYDTPLFGFGFFAPPPVYYPPQQRGYYRSPPLGYYGY